MENFAVDLDKVLDDFEFDEDNPAAVSPTIRADVNSQILPKPAQDLGIAKGRPDGAFTTDAAQASTQLRKNVYNARYNLPFDSSDKFDMSGANFGPSPPRTTFVTSSSTNSHGYDSPVATGLTSGSGNDSGYGSQQFGFECNNGTVGSLPWNRSDINSGHGFQTVISGPAVTQGLSKPNTRSIEDNNGVDSEVTSSRNAPLSEPEVDVSRGHISVNSNQEDSFGLPDTPGDIPGSFVKNETNINVTVVPETLERGDSLEPVGADQGGLVNSGTGTDVSVPVSEHQPEVVDGPGHEYFSAPQPGITPAPMSGHDVNATKTCVGQIKVLPCYGNDSPVHSLREEVVISEPHVPLKDVEPTQMIKSYDSLDMANGHSVDSNDQHDDSLTTSSFSGDFPHVGESVTSVKESAVPCVTSAAERVTVVADVNTMDINMQVPVGSREQSNTTDDAKVSTVRTDNDKVTAVETGREDSETGKVGENGGEGRSVGVVVEQTGPVLNSDASVEGVNNAMQAGVTALEPSATVVQPTATVAAAVVGFGDISDDVDDAEMDSYLGDVETSDNTGRESNVVVSDGGISHKTDPQVLAEQDPNLNSSVHDKSNILPSPVVTNFQTQFSSESNEEPSIIQPEVLPFLVETPTESLSTPAEDPGFSRVPGLPGSGLKSNLEKTSPTLGIATLDIHAPSTSVTNSGLGLPQTQATGIGARPKESSQIKAPRPNSLIGLSKPSLPTMPIASANSDVPLDVSISDTSANALLGLNAVQSAMFAMEQPAINTHDVRNQQIADQTKTVINKKQLNVEIKHQIEQEKRSPVSQVGSDSGQNNLNLLTNTGGGKLHTNNFDSPVQASEADCLPSPSSFSMRPPRPNSFPACSAPSPQGKQKRPTSLNLPPRTDFGAEQGDESPKSSPAMDTGSASPSRFEDDVMGVTTTTLPPNVGISSSPVQEGATSAPAVLVTEPTYPQPPPASPVSQIGKVAPIWVPDSEAANCMQCDSKFTFTRRRHHCRACGKVFCSNCCNLKSKLPYMDNKEARVCQLCHVSLIKDSARPWSVSLGEDSYPSSSVLRREGTLRKGEPKSVMFSDGIRPGGDLTELDGSSEQRPLMRKTGRTAKKVERIPTPVAPPDGAENTAKTTTTTTLTTVTTVTASPSKMRQVRLPEANRNVCLIPETGLPPVISQTGVKGDYSIEEDPDPDILLPILKSDDLSPVVFAVNKNLFVLVKILNLDCCVNRVCWCFTTKGMCTVGQDEIVIVLECLPDEKTVPRDIFSHLNTVYEEAGKGNTVSDLGHTIFGQSFLGSKDHGGFLYIRPTFQCLQKIILPEPPYVFGILLQKWETPWAKVFPIRLMLRLGAEYRYYPCPLISVRFRNSAFMEIGHTIMNLLADFRSYQYMLPQIKGVTIHMEDKITYINFPRNRYDEVMKVISNSNDHVMALGASFSTEADSHLVCIQNDEGNYQTQAINIQNKPRKVTGASFVVFNGALKSSSGLSAKSSIVEDGLMVQIAPDSMMALKQALRDMKDYRIGCGSVEAPQPEEVVMVQWTDDDKNVNIGIKSPIDQMAMDGVKSIRISNATDYVGETRTIRWTEVFFIQEDSGTSRCDPVDLSRLAETINRAACVALVPHLDKLKEESLTKIGLRITVDAEKVGYEIGSNGEKLPSLYMNDLDNELIPVIHNAASNSHDSPITLELIFHILE
ncbi:zinc finger FYVE domain-containing protein 9-like isoform X2 [Lineus longissimus]|uniref:zinc finger FYVE domain-containing protein 9-like isoform X2 n=1 Tax=Lineus longissimus TaxID=88925 RepID=UPI00315D4216